ncbi:fumarylacetoacetate hydrolase family protein [Woeseiaceae bacterium]|nr:fumarylacetoacetate hydrolase family protein [Woeseiaceae bacterium]
MKLLRIGPAGQEKPCILDNSGIRRDLSSVVDDIASKTLLPENIEVLCNLDLNHLPVISESERIGACVGNIGKFVCIGLNYADHASETGVPIPKEPIIFNKWTSAICGPNDEIIKPRNSTKLDWEVELGIVIGKPGIYIDEDHAEEHIAGYCVINDISERKFQLEQGGQWDKGKGCDTFGPIGPWLVTKDDAGDVTNLPMWLKVNEKIYQNSNTKMMVFHPNFLVSYLSNYMSLQSGDIISTGTPSGVGMGQKPPIFLKAGDIMELGIKNLGEQRQTVIST